MDVEPRQGLEAVIRSASQHLLDRQNPEGYWLGELEADTTLESDYILLQLWLYPPGADGRWTPPTRQKLEKAARYILKRQLPDGGWNLYPGGPANISACVKAYFALKLVGLHGSQESLKRARRRILELGGVEAANSYTKIYLSYFDLYERGKVPTIPAELFLIPKETGFSIYEMSSWSRAMLAPLAILGARRAKRPLPAGFELGEIFTGNGPAAPDPISLRNVFLWIDRGLKVWERNGYKPAREKAVAAAAEWMIEHLKDSDGLGAIYPAMLNSIMALTELGYGLDDPLLARELAKFEELVIEEPETLRVQPCLSPVWDTALASYAIGFANPEQSGAVRYSLTRAADWLQTREVRKKGDWSIKNSKAEPGGWYFEFANEFYPDTDDTAKVLLAYQFARAGDSAAQRATVRRAIDWLLSMQSSDGGWAAFDVDNNSQLLTHVPFADHNAMLDPTCPDITGRVVEALCKMGPGRSHVSVRRAVEYLKSVQEEDGSWAGRWGVNFIYGTCFALRGLAAAGEDTREAYIIRAGEWLRSIQNADGGWGETCGSYDDSLSKGVGPSTASQTAWALLGLFASGDYESGSVDAGLNYLFETQRPDGSWTEEHYTGTGFPRVFYLKYHLYSQYFPLMALGQYQRECEKRFGTGAKNGA